MSGAHHYTLANNEELAPVDGDAIYRGNLHETAIQVDPGVHLASLAEKRRLWWRNAIINLLFIGSWFFFATLLSVYNKWMFSADHFGFPYPLFVTTLHMFVQFVLAACLRFIWPARFKPEHSPNREDYGRKAVPCGITTGLDIGLSNLSLKTITLSFYTMVKSSSLIFVLLFAFLFHLESFSVRLIGVIFLIFSGVLLMVATQTHFVFGGFILVLSASALGGLRWSLTQLLLKNKKMGMDNPAATVFWLAPVMGISLAMISAVVERWTRVFSTPFFDSLVATLNTSFFLIFPGVLAFCMVLSEFYIIQRAGIIPMSIAGIAKEVTTITISAWFFGDELTPLNITGVSITVCGIGLFTYHRYRKSIESTVPLDAHGNPITEDENTDALRVPLVGPENAGGGLLESRHSYDRDQDGQPASASQLFSVGSDEDLDAEESRNDRPSKIASSGLRADDAHRDDDSSDPQNLIDENQDVESAWERGTGGFPPR